MSVTLLDLHPAAADLQRLVTEGLRRRPRQLPAWMLYDAEGSRLFAAICEQPEYTLPRTEIALLERHAEAIAAAYNKLQLHSHCAVSDSGTISEESSILGFPAVTVRKSIERPEAMDTGAITLAGLQADAVLECIREVARQWAAGEVPEVPQDYRIENTSQRVLNLILGTARLHGDWSGFNDRAFER